MRVWLLVLAPTACGPDARPSDCAGAPDFFVHVTAEEGRLPPDTVVRVYYGGSGTDTYQLDGLTRPRILFCTPIEAEAPATGGMGGAASTAEAGQGSGAGGAAGADGAYVARLECELWSQGPACIEVEAGVTRWVAEELVLQPDICTASERLELPLDGEGDPELSRCRDH